MTDHRIAATTTWGPDVPCPHCDGRPLIPAPYWTKHLTRHHPETPMPEPTPAELTVEEARDLVDEMSLDLYRAQDAIEFVREMCALREKNQRASAGQGEVQTGEILAWLKGPQCGRQMLAEQSAPAPVPADVRDQIAAAVRTVDIDYSNLVMGAGQGPVDDDEAHALADAVLRVPAIAEAFERAEEAEAALELYGLLYRRAETGRRRLERVRAECDRIEAAVRANPTSPDFDGAYLAAIGHIRRALNPQETP